MKDDKFFKKFFHQLRLLLWKNFIIKKRKLFVFMFELIVPLVLFLIMFAIRVKQTAIPVDTVYFNAWPLPSAGFIPLMQSFCRPENGIRNENGFIEYPNSTAKEMLSKIDKILKSNWSSDWFNQKDENYLLSKQFLDNEALINLNLLNSRLSNLKKSHKSNTSETILLSELFNLKNNTKKQTKLNKVLSKSNFFLNYQNMEEINLNLDNLNEVLSNSKSENNDKNFTIKEKRVDLMHTIFCNQSQYSKVKNSTENLCNISRDDLNELDDVLFYDDKSDIKINIEDFSNFEQAIEDLSQLSVHFPSGLCKSKNPDEIIQEGDKLRNERKPEALINENTITNGEGLKDTLQKNSGLIGLWFAMQETFCGSKPTKQNENKNGLNQTNNLEFDSLDLSRQQIKALSLLFQVINSNPVILYSPNSTLIKNQIIKKTNGTFELIDKINSFSRQWLKNSEKLRHLLNNETTNESISNFFRFKKSQNKTIKTLLSQIDIIDSAACSWLSLMSSVNLNLFKGFNDEKDLVEYFLNQAYFDNVTVIASVVFDVKNTSIKLDPHIKYKIRQNASFTYTTKKIRERYWYPSPRDWDYYYYLFGFVWLQDLIDRAIIDYHSNSTILEPGAYLNQMPYPCYMIDNFLQMIQHVMPLCLAISFVYTVAMLTQTIVYEKEMRLKEVMKIMGLNNSVHIIAWFITYFLQFTLVMILVTFILHYGKILSHSNPFLIFILLEIFATATICFSFLVSALYSKAKLAAACAGILYFLSYVPCMYISIREDVAFEIIPSWAKTIACLLSTSAFGISSKYIAFYENDGAGLQWNNLNKSPLENDNYNCINCIIIMLIDCFLYLLLAWYVENVNPSYGIPLPWTYPFKYSYWSGKQDIIFDEEKSLMKKIKNFFRRNQKLSFTESDQARLLNESFETNPTRLRNRLNLLESEPSNLKIGVSIRNLFKKYSDSKLAVDNLSINFYESQITSFLGHNGAGKTTTMSILTGLIPPSSGYALIYDKDIRKDINEIRKNLGFCPQHNILFEKLTVEEHLWFYAKLKFIQDSAIEVLIENLLSDTGLIKKRNNLVHTLSGGMQRKLSVAIAFVGDANLVILDEPTAGVDPHARRAIWDLLLKYKQGRTIILSTHHMDEAELLGDRIAIISSGRLQCCGTSLFLKNALGEGNNLTLVKDSESIEKDISLHRQEFIKNGIDSPLIKSLYTSFDFPTITLEIIPYLLKRRYIDEILNLIHQYVPSAFLKDETLREYQFVLPLDERSNSSYWNLFKALEKNFENLKVKSYGIHDVSLEEIFVKAVELKTIKKNSDEEKESSLSVSANSIKDTLYDLDYIYTDLESSYRLYFKQIKSMVTKRFLYNKRNWKSLITQIVLPACFVSIAMTVALSAPGFLDLPPLELTPAQFYPLTKPEGIYIPFSYRPNLTDSHHKSANTTEIINSLFVLVGLGSTCTLNKQGLNLQDLIIKNYTKKGVLLNQSYFGYSDSCKNVFNQNSDFNYFPLNNKSSSQNFLLMDGKKNPSKFKSYTPKCNCLEDNSGFICSGLYEIPPDFKTLTHEILLNITGENETNYYLSTTDLYRLKRYGGLSFDNEKPFKNEDENLLENYELIQNLEKHRKARIWYNNKGFHAMPVFLNVLNNALLRANVKKNLKDTFRINDYGITVINHPMNQTNNYLSTEYLLQGSDVLISIFTIVAMSFVNASFVLFLVYERSIKSLHLQFLMGLNPLLYWITNFIWDMFNYMLPASCVIIIFKIFDVPAFVHGSNYPAVILLFLFYGWSVSPLMYPMTFLFKEPSSAYIFLIVINLFTGITCVESSFLLQVFSFNSDLKFIYDFLKIAFLIFPPYCLGRGLIDIAYNDYYNTFYMKTGQISKMRSPFEWDITTRNLVAMACIGLVSWIFTLLLEYDFFKFKWLRKNKHENVSSVYVSKNEDSDVRNERLRIENSHEKNDKLILKSLRKVYSKRTKFSIKNFFKLKDKKQFIAVKNLSFGVPEGECFGLLGVNGAGKTTTFKMLTTDLEPTSGDVLVREGHNLIDALNNKKAYWNKIGYCPQFDALYDELTPDEHIRLFARVKGVKTKYEKILSDSLLERLDLLHYGNKPAGQLSLGNKRKLSTALALVGNPSIILLDEPTSGQDPVSRRKLWEEIINLTRIKNKSVLLTSHSMEECEALCTRLAIMVDGYFRCMGSVQHLKTKFGDGYTLTIKLREMSNHTVTHMNTSLYRSIDDISNEHTTQRPTCSKHQTTNKYINTILYELKTKIHPECKLKERNFNNVYQFELKTPQNDSSYDIGDIYRLIELNKLRFNICDYSLSQNTLDNVFINFVKEQTSKKVSLDKEDSKLLPSDDSEEEIENTRCEKKFLIDKNPDTDDLLIDAIDENLIDFESVSNSPKLVLSNNDSPRNLSTFSLLNNFNNDNLKYSKSKGPILNDDISAL